MNTRKLLSLADTSIVNYYGRNYITDKKVTFLNTSSGFEVCFYGDELKATFTRRGNGKYDGEQTMDATLLRLRVYLDGDLSVENSKIVILNGDTDGKEITVAKFDTVGKHTVLVRKMNYEWWGYVELLGISGTDKFFDAPKRPDRKFLIYGDSLTVGFGVDYKHTGDVGGDCPEKEDGTVSYGVRFADYFNAEAQLYCISGVSIGVPCWREHTIVDDDRYCQYSFFDEGSLYDMSQFVPEIVFCNLGTNDAGGLINGLSNFGNGSAYAHEDKYTGEDERVSYLKFIKGIKELYPDTKIVAIYGMVGTHEPIGNAIRAAVDECGYKDVYYFNMNPVECSENAGHPTVDGQDYALKQLIEFVETNKLL